MSECAICGIDHGKASKYHEKEARVLATTFPKSGTNLLIQYLGRPAHIRVSGSVLFEGVGLVEPDEAMNTPASITEHQIRNFTGVAFGHVPCHEEFWAATHSVPTLVIALIRDPRDVIVSHALWVKKRPVAHMNYLIDGVPLSERIDPIGDLIRMSAERWKGFLGWLRKPTLVVRFEELVRNPVDICRRIVTRVPVSVFRAGSAEGMVNRADKESSPTYRKGHPGDWVNHFTTEHMRLYQEHMAETHRELGYAE
jgi:hypothetical protein